MILQLLDFDTIVSIIFLAVTVLIVCNTIGLLAKLKRRLRKPESTLQEVETSKNRIRLELPKPVVTPSHDPRVLRVLRSHKLAIFNILVIGMCVWLAYSATSPTPAIDYAKSYPRQEAAWEDFSKPLDIVFNMPVEANKLRPFLSREELQGDWKYDPYLGIPGLTRHAKFYPKNTLPPEERLVVYMTGVSRLFVDESHEHALNFFTYNPPEIYSTFPVNDSIEVKTPTDIRFTFNQPLKLTEKWDYQIDPEIKFSVVNQDDHTVILKPDEPLEQSQTYTIKITRISQEYDISVAEVTSQEDPVTIHELTFSTVRSPLIKTFTPGGTGVLPDTPIKAVFEVAMDPQSVAEKLVISPDFEHTLVWEADRRLTIVPKQPLKKDTLYSFTLKQGVKSKAGGESEQAAKYTFHTIGPVKVMQITPTSGSSKVTRNTTINVAFDQEVDHKSAEAHFQISPSAKGTFSWKNNTLKFTPSQSYAFSTTYTVTINPGVKTVYGLDSNSKFTSKFTTVSDITIIPGFAWDHQDYDMTCAVASMKMILAYKGYYQSELGLISQMGHQPDQYIYDSSIGAYRWGNPNVGFVGASISGGGGTDPNRAFGVYWDPIIRVFKNNYGINTKLYTNWNAAGLASEIQAGHPVQIWWWNGLSWTEGDVGGKRMDWYTSVATGSKRIYAINGMHSVVVMGFAGDATNPTGFYLMDPWFGYYFKSVGAFNNQWRYYNNTGVAVY